MPVKRCRLNFNNKIIIENEAIAEVRLKIV